jgi:hypothetical protein
MQESNPTLSATQSKLQRNCPAFCREIWKTRPYFVIFRPQSGLERADCPGPNGVNLAAFLWRGHSQSGFSDSFGRMQCDHKPTMRRKRLDLVKPLGPQDEPARIEPPCNRPSVAVRSKIFPGASVIRSRFGRSPTRRSHDDGAAFDGRS